MKSHKILHEEKAANAISYVFTPQSDALQASPNRVWIEYRQAKYAVKDNMGAEEQAAIKQKYPWVVLYNGSDSREFNADASRGMYLEDKSLEGKTDQEIDGHFVDFLAKKKNPATKLQNLARLKDEYTQGMQITAASCVLVGLSGLPVNVALSYQYANFTYSEAEDQIYFEMQVGDFYCYPESCGSEETEDVKVNKLLLPGEVKVRFKWRDDYGFELKDVSFSNSALAAIGTQFGDERKLTLEELLQHAAQAYQEETQFDNALANLSHTLALLEDNNLHKQAGNDLLVKANKIALVFPADRALLGEALYQTKRLIRSAGGSLGKPQEHAHYHYEKLIQKISQQKSWGKILAGAMLAVLGVALIGLCCATGFGALVLPVLSWGLSYLVGAGVIGGLASVAGMGLFAKGVQRNRAMSEVAKDSQQLLAGVKSGYPVYQAGKQVP